jgi:TusA-related sulfurtransferase
MAASVFWVWHQQCTSHQVNQANQAKPSGWSIDSVMQKADYILDFRETITALALLKMTQVLREMNNEEVLEIITRDSEVRADVFKVIPTSSCELIDMEFNKKADCFRIQLKKTRHFHP